MAFDAVATIMMLNDHLLCVWRSFRFAINQTEEQAACRFQSHPMLHDCGGNAEHQSEQDAERRRRAAQRAANSQKRVVVVDRRGGGPSDGERVHRCDASGRRGRRDRRRERASDTAVVIVAETADAMSSSA